MCKMTYKNLGNVPKKYEYKPRIVGYSGLIKDPKLILKFYEMYIMDEPLEIKVVDQAKDFLLDEIKANKIKPEIGFGFAILSEDMLNIAKWDKKYPEVLKNQIYCYENNDFSTAKLEDINDVGAFCRWDLDIVNFEKNAWKEYLKSNRTEENKEKYLSTLIEDVLL